MSKLLHAGHRSLRATFTTEVKSWLLALTLLYVAAQVALRTQGIQPPPPWAFLLVILLIAAPLAYVLANALHLLDTHLRVPRHVAAAVYVSAGLVLVASYQSVFRDVSLVLGAFAATAVIASLRGRTGLVTPIVIGGPILFLGYASVWSLNYLLLSFVTADLRDPELFALDVRLYGSLLGRPVEPAGMFPLIRVPAFFTALENAYHILFVELFVVLFVHERQGRSIVPYLRTVFLTYFIGLGVFLTYPAVGPCIYFPFTFDGTFSHTETYALMQSMRNEYNALLTRDTLSGFGYFVALPSLHVAQAVVLQSFLAASRPLFWMFLPVNVLMIGSTFLLGYHYLLDVPAGIALALAGIRVSRPAARLGIQTRRN